MIRVFLPLLSRIGLLSRLRPKFFDFSLLFTFFVFLNWQYFPPDRALPYEWFTDVLKLTKPVMAYSGESLLQGELPLWNPYYYTGFPNLAMGCAGVFYPTTPLYGLLHFARAFTFDALLHVLLAGIFVYALCRSNKCSRPVAVVMGCVTFSAKIFWAKPPLIQYVSYPMTLISLGHIWSVRLLAWTPLVLLFALALLERPRLKYALGLAVVTTLQLLTGDLQLFVCQWYVVGLVFGLEWVRRIYGGKVSRALLYRSLIMLTVGVSVGAAAGAIQWAPSQELLHYSTRAHGASLEYIRVWGEGKTIQEAILNIALMLSIVPLTVLFLAGLISPREPLRLTLIVTLLIILFLTIWPDTPIAASIHRLPLIGQSREPLRILHPAMFLVLLIAARELDRLLKSSSKKTANVATLYILGAIVAVAAWIQIGATVTTPIFVAFLFVALAILVQVGRKSFPAIRKVACTLVLGAILASAYDIHAWTTQLFQTFQYEPHREISSFLESYQGPERVAIIDEDYHKGYASVGSSTNDRTIGGGHALVLGDYAEWFTKLTGAGLVQRNDKGELVRDYYDVFSLPEWLNEKSSGVLDLLSIRYLLFTSDAPSWVANNPERFVLSKQGKINVYENRKAMPAAFIVHDVKRTGNLLESINALGNEGFNYRESATADVDLALHRLPSEDPNDKVEITSYGRNSVEGTASLNSDGLVVFTEAMYPGWYVSVDNGKPSIPIVADGIFKAVAVPSGRHTIQFTFNPPIYWRGFWIGLAGLVTTAIFACVCLVSNRRTSKWITELV